MVFVDSIRFDPLVVGTNKAKLSLVNRDSSQHLFAVHVQSACRSGGWGTVFFRNLEAGERVEWEVEFRFVGEPTALSWIRLRFYKPKTEDAYQFEDYEEERWFVGPATTPYEPPPDIDSGEVPYILLELDLRQSTREFQHCQSQYYDIYYEVSSKAETDIKAIAGERDKGVEEIAAWLGVPPGPRIQLFFFSDAQTKKSKTGHEGEGWAFRRNIVEVYNDNVKLDPYHEATHILAADLGCPPALFQEGLATYMSERMGHPPLQRTDLSLFERVRELKQAGTWIAFDMLFTFTEIGSTESNPLVSYAEAGAFVKFLVEEYGRGKLLQAYTRLKNSKDEEVYQRNVGDLGEIYGIPLTDLAYEFERCISK